MPSPSSLAFLFLPSLPLQSPPLTDTNTTRKIREKFQVTCCAFMSIRDAPYPRLRKAAGHIFPLHEKVNPPLADIRRRALIFLTRSFSHSLFLSCEHYYILTRLSLLLSFSPSVHTPTLSLSLTVTLTTLSVFSFSISFFLSAPESARLLSSLCLSYLFELR